MSLRLINKEAKHNIHPILPANPQQTKPLKMKNYFICLLASFLCATSTKAQASLSSYPAATATIYLDFDGEEVHTPMWNNGNAFTCAQAPMTTAQITEVFNRVSEDYRPFNINITTDFNIFLAAPITKRIRVIITPTSDWFAGVGGVAFVGSFSWGDDTPCFVFCDRLANYAKYVAECCSHESGHTMGLSHQSKYDNSCNLTATYNEGVGTGEVAWAPIMGNSYYRNMSGWNNGPTPYGCSSNQDNLTIISSQNGFTYRSDDYSDDINISPNQIDISALTMLGLISTNIDKDAFKFTLNQNSNVWLTINPFSVAANNEGADLDVKMTLYDKNKQLIKVYDPANSLSVIVDTILLEGTYYMVVDGTGNNNASDYGSIGSYSITGITKLLPVCSVRLAAKVIENGHSLSWQVNCNEGLQSVEVQTSLDGSNFSSISSLYGAATNFNYTPQRFKNIFYRIKIITLGGQTAFSNIVLLTATKKTIEQFVVTTTVTNEIAVQAETQYEYVLSDVKGNMLQKGNRATGAGKINTSLYPSGFYFLQLFADGKRQTERIFKQ